MALPEVAVFTDTYLPTVNGVSYTIETWRDRWAARGGRMDVVYPDAPSREPADAEFPVAAVDFPFYDGYRLGAPAIPTASRDVDLVHAHTPFLMGLTGARLARREDVPLVVSHHTPIPEYTQYVASGRIGRTLRRAAAVYERRFLDRASAIITPSAPAARQLRESGVTGELRVVPNGVDTAFFRPVDADRRFRDRHGLPEGPLVGYTGRHGFEKNLGAIIEAVEGVDASLVFGGDGPAREQLEREAAQSETEVHFIGFLAREELPEFYSTLSVFAFPSPVETQGLVALEANACGTPVVGVDQGALTVTIADGQTGYHFEEGDVAGFRAGLRRAMADSTRLGERCLDRREEMSVERAIDRLEQVYAGARAAHGGEGRQRP